MDLKRIKELIELFAATDLAELSLREGDCELRLARRAPTGNGGTCGAWRSVETESTMEPITGGAEAAAPHSSAVEAVNPDGSETNAGAKEVLAPMHGVLHLAPEPDAPPFVTPGDSVRAGQTLGLLEAMKVFHALKSDVDGAVAILASSGSEVAAGQPLFRIT